MSTASIERVGSVAEGDGRSEGTGGGQNSEARTAGRCRAIATVELGPTTWRIDSDCGVVKIHSTRDGCLTALNAFAARRAALELCVGLRAAADSVERASRGEPR